MKFDLFVRVVALIAGVVVVGFAFWMFHAGNLGRFACVALGGMGLLMVVAVLASNRLRPVDLSKIRAELQQVRREVITRQEDVLARQEEIKRLCTNLSEVLLVVGRWTARENVEPPEMRKWKQQRLLETVGYADPSTEHKDHVLRLVRLIDRVDSTTGEAHERAYADLLEAFRGAYKNV